MVGITDELHAVGFDLAAWGVLAHTEAEAIRRQVRGKPDDDGAPRVTEATEYW